MSTEQEDAAMLLELNEKITHRIREQIVVCVQGYEQNYGSESLDAPIVRTKLITDISMYLINSPGFITELTKKIGAKMANVHY